MQRRTYYLGDTFSITETIRDATGAAIDLSAATLAAKVRSPSGTVSSLTVTGNASGVATISGSLASEEGLHMLAVSVNNVTRINRGIMAVETALFP